MNDYATYAISNYRLALFTIILIIPILIDKYLDTKFLKSTFISAGRMVIQLILVGFYLTYVFDLNNIFLNILWILIMAGVANFSILNHTGLKIKKFFFLNYIILIFSVAVIQLSLLIVFDIKTIFSARYLIPLEGMILGNILRCNIIGVDRFFSEIRKRKDEYILYISLGATPNEAVKSFWRSAYITALKPQLASLATIGLVSLPGMMTGQMLGGTEPLTAVKYQILIMTAIFTSASLTIFLSLFISCKKVFDSFGRIREDIFDT